MNLFEKIELKRGKLIVFFDVMVGFPTKIMRLMGKKNSNYSRKLKTNEQCEFFK